MNVVSVRLQLGTPPTHTGMTTYVGMSKMIFE